MRLPIETLQHKHDRLTKWHKWFAWHPVFDGEHYVWFEYVERKGEWAQTDFNSYGWCWEYRSLSV